MVGDLGPSREIASLLNGKLARWSNASCVPHIYIVINAKHVKSMGFTCNCHGEGVNLRLVTIIL